MVFLSATVRASGRKNPQAMIVNNCKKCLEGFYIHDTTSAPVISQCVPQWEYWHIKNIMKSIFNNQKPVKSCHEPQRRDQPAFKWNHLMADKLIYCVHAKVRAITARHHHLITLDQVMFWWKHQNMWILIDSNSLVDDSRVRLIQSDPIVH